MNVKGRPSLERRLTYLWSFELLAAGLFTLYLGLTWEEAHLGARTLVGLGLADFLLIQGSLYWYAKLRSIRRRPWLSNVAFHALFRTFRALDLALLAAAGAWLVFEGLTAPRFTRDLGLGCAFGLLAGLEYVNYFHYQLMYDTVGDLKFLRTHRRLKASLLGRDMAKGHL